MTPRVDRARERVLERGGVGDALARPGAARRARPLHDPVGHQRPRRLLLGGQPRLEVAPPHDGEPRAPARVVEVGRDAMRAAVRGARGRRDEPAQHRVLRRDRIRERSLEVARRGARVAARDPCRRPDREADGERAAHALAQPFHRGRNRTRTDAAHVRGSVRADVEDPRADPPRRRGPSAGRVSPSRRAPEPDVPRGDRADRLRAALRRGRGRDAVRRPAAPRARLPLELRLAAARPQPPRRARGDRRGARNPHAALPARRGAADGLGARRAPHQARAGRVADGVLRVERIGSG